MKLKQSIRYQLEDYKASVLVYYCAVVALIVLMSVALGAVAGAGSNLEMSGISAMSALFLFVCGLCSLHDNLPMLLQNGVSRKTMFLARLVVTGITAAFCAIVDHVLSMVINLLARPFFSGYTVSLFEQEYGSIYPSMGAVPMTLFSLLFSFLLLLLASCLGYFIIVFFYRLSKPMRIVVGVCAAFLLTFGLPGAKMLDSVFLGEQLRAFSQQYVEPVADAITASPLLTMGCWALTAVALSAVTWLLLRRTTVRR